MRSDALTIKTVKLDGRPTNEIISHLQVPRDDPGLLVVPGCVPGQLEDLGSEVLHDGGKVDGGAGTHPLGVVPLAEKPTKYKVKDGHRYFIRITN